MSETLTEGERWLLAEKERLEYWVDVAFLFASDGGSSLARAALTSARWGEKKPSKLSALEYYRSFRQVPSLRETWGR